MTQGACEFCGVKLIVLPTSNGSVLPVEIKAGQKYTDDTEFNKSVHTSHLLNCPQQAKAWPAKKRKYITPALPAISPKDLHK